MDWKLHAARWAMGELSAKDLPHLAVEALREGADSPSLAQLASHDRASTPELRELFMTVLAERGVEPPSRGEAVQLLAQRAAAEIVRGSVSPEEGARRIGHLADELAAPRPPGLLLFIGLESEIEDFGDEVRLRYYGAEHCAKVQTENREQIVAAARVLADTLEERDPAKWWMSRDPATGPTAPRPPAAGDARLYVVGAHVWLKGRPDRVRTVVSVEWHSMRHCYVYLVDTRSKRRNPAYWFADQLLPATD